MTTGVAELSVKMSLSPATTLLLSKLPLTLKVVAVLSSAALTRPSLLVSVVISTVGAVLALGAVVSSVALSAALAAVVLPMGSCSWAVTLRVPPSAGLAKVVVAKPLAMSVSVSVIVVTTGVAELSVKMILSPATTLVLSKLPVTVKVVALASSALLTRPSLLVSVVMRTVGAVLSLGAVVSSLALSGALAAVVLPAVSCSWAVTLKMPPSDGLAKVVVAKLASMSSCVRVTILTTGVAELSVKMTLSPTTTLFLLKLPVTVKVLAPLSSAALTRKSLLASVVMATVGAVLSLGAMVSSLAESLALMVLTLPTMSCRRAVTLRVPPSAGLAKVVVAKPLSMSSCVSVTVLTTGVAELSVKRILSPATALVLSKLPLTVKVVALPSSALLTRASLLLSVVISTVTAGAVRSMVMGWVLVAPAP